MNFEIKFSTHKLVGGTFKYIIIQKIKEQELEQLPGPSAPCNSKSIMQKSDYLIPFSMQYKIKLCNCLKVYMNTHIYGDINGSIQIYMQRVKIWKVLQWVNMASVCEEK